MAEITKTYSVANVDDLIPNTENRFEVTSSAPSLRLMESNFSNPEFVRVGNLDLSIKEDGTYRVDGVVGTLITTALRIPSKYDGVDVTEIYEKAFKGNATLTSVSIPACVTKIGKEAFKDCTALKSVTIDEDDKISVFLQAPIMWSAPYAKYKLSSDDSEFTSIAMSLFDANQNLYRCEIPLEAYSITFSDVVITNSPIASPYIIPENPPTTLAFDTMADDTGISGPVSFLYLKPLEGANLPSSIGLSLSIGENAFAGCTQLASMVLPSRTAVIGNSVFRGCTSLLDFAIKPNHRTTRIGEGAFLGCTNLKQVSLENGIKHIGYSAFNGCEKLKIIDLPSTLETIGQYAFNNCFELVEFTIPMLVNTIGNFAFYWGENHTGLRHIAFENPYTWFISKDATVNPRNLELMKPTYIYDGKTGSQSSVTHLNGMRFSYTEENNSSGNCAEYYWHRLDKMPAPEISIDNGILNMTDPLGVAERFYIYVDGKKKVTIEVD